MIIPKITWNLTRRELEHDSYALKALPTNSIKEFLDIGANYGFISILARLLHPAAKIVSVEPYRPVYEALCNNVASLDIKTRNIALGTGEPSYLALPRTKTMCNKFRQSDNPNPSWIKTESKTLYKMIKLDHLHPKDLYIKCDVEGAENYLLDDKKSLDVLGICAGLAIEIHRLDPNSYWEFINKLTKFYSNKLYTITTPSAGHKQRTMNIIRNDLASQIKR